MVAWGGGLFRFADAIPKEKDSTVKVADAIVVLTGGSGRLREGLDLLSRDFAGHLFVSGVYQGIDVRRLLKLARGTDDLEARIGIGNATNTKENAEETAVWINARGYKSLRLVTAAYHMPRSLMEFENAMPDVKIIPHPIFPAHVKQDEWWAWPGTAGLIVGEYNKTIVAWLRHRVQSIVPGGAGSL